MSSLGHLTSPAARGGRGRERRGPPGDARGRARRHAAEAILPATTALAACGLVAYLVLSSRATGDYRIGAPVGADNAAPAIAALSHGNVAGFLSQQPLMGLLSLLTRAPLAALTALLGGGSVAIYHVGAVACVVPTGLLAARLAAPTPSAAASRSRASLRAGGLITAGALLISPPILNALRYGHPEEVLAATLAAFSLLAAYGGRPVLTGVLIGAAIGTKDWASIAALPALIALPDGRRRATLVGGGLALALVVPAPLLDPAAFARASGVLDRTHLVNALSAWWPLSSPFAASVGAPPVRVLPGHLTKGIALPLGLALAGALSFAATLGRPGARLRERGRSVDAFAVLCLLAVVRCIADTGPVEYYYVALVIPLAVWESAVLRRLPLVTLLAVAAVSLTYERSNVFAAGSLNAITFAWTGVLVCYLAFRAFCVGVDPRRETDRKAG